VGGPQGGGHVLGVMGNEAVAAAVARGPTTPTAGDIQDHFENGENLIAGAISGLIAETVMHPFDTVSHRAKVHPSSMYGTFAGAFRLIYRQGAPFN